MFPFFSPLLLQNIVCDRAKQDPLARIDATLLRGINVRCFEKNGEDSDQCCIECFFSRIQDEGGMIKVHLAGQDLVLRTSDPAGQEVLLMGILY